MSSLAAPRHAQPLCPDRDQPSAAMVALDRLRVHPRNIRQILTGLDELAASIRYEGVLVPLLAHRKYLRRAGQPDLELLDGHRRLAASRIAGLRRVPVIIYPAHRDDEAMLAMLAATIGQVAVEPADLGRAVATLRTEFGYSYRTLAERLGVSLAEVKTWTEGGSQHGPRRQRQQGTAQGSARRRPWRPAIRPAQVHDVLSRWDGGEVDAASLIEEMRGWLGGWSPATAPSQGSGPSRASGALPVTAQQQMKVSTEATAP